MYGLYRATQGTCIAQVIAFLNFFLTVKRGLLKAVFWSLTRQPNSKPGSRAFVGVSMLCFWARSVTSRLRLKPLRPSLLSHPSGWGGGGLLVGREEPAIDSACHAWKTSSLLLSWLNEPGKFEDSPLPTWHWCLYSVGETVGWTGSSCFWWR